MRVHILAYKTSLTPPHFIEKPLANQEELSSIYVIYMFFSFSAIFFDEIVLTV